MRKVYLILLLALLVNSLQETTAQNSNPCNFRWGSWQTAMTSQWGNVEYQVQWSTCNREGGVCGWPKIQLSHTMGYNASIDIKLKGTDCENKVITASFSTAGKYIPGNTPYNDQGNWHYFKTVTEVVSVEVWMEKDGEKYRMIMDKEKGINKIYKNGSVMLLNGKTEDEVQKEKDKQVEIEKKKKEEDMQKEEKEEQKRKEDKQAEIEKKKQEEDQRKQDKARADEEQKAQQAAADREAKRYGDSLKAIEEDRTNRLQAIQKKDNEEKAAVAGIGLAVGTLAISDATTNEITGRKFQCKAEVALAFIQIPVISNTAGRDEIYKWSSHENLSYFGGSIGLYAGFRPVNMFEIYVKPLLTYGVQLG